MGGEKRRENLLKILQESESAVSGTKLATKFQVSRQVIVQDIALLRAKNHDIIRRTCINELTVHLIREKIKIIFHECLR